MSTGKGEAPGSRDLVYLVTEEVARRVRLEMAESSRPVVLPDAPEDPGVTWHMAFARAYGYVSAGPVPGGADGSGAGPKEPVALVIWSEKDLR
jgi:hypothetical protein